MRGLKDVPIIRGDIDVSKSTSVVFAASFNPGGEWTFRIGDEERRLTPNITIAALVNPSTLFQDPVQAFNEATYFLQIKHPLIPEGGITITTKGLKNVEVGRPLDTSQFSALAKNTPILNQLIPFANGRSGGSLDTASVSVNAGFLLEVPGTRFVLDKLAQQLVILAFQTDAVGVAAAPGTGGASLVVGALDNIPLFVAADTLKNTKLLVGLGFRGAITTDAKNGGEITISASGGSATLSINALANFITSSTADISEILITLPAEGAEFGPAPDRFLRQGVVAAVGNRPAQSDEGRIAAFVRQRFNDDLEGYAFRALKNLIDATNREQRAKGQPQITGTTLEELLSSIGGSSNIGNWNVGLRNEIDRLIIGNYSSDVDEAIRGIFQQELRARFNAELEKRGTTYTNTSAELLRFLANVYSSTSDNTRNGNQVIDEIYENTTWVYGYDYANRIVFEDVTGTVRLSDGTTVSQRQFLSQVYAEAFRNYYRADLFQGKRPGNINELNDYVNFISALPDSSVTSTNIQRLALADLVDRSFRSTGNPNVDGAIRAAYYDFIAIERSRGRLDTIDQTLRWLINVDNSNASDPNSIKSLIIRRANENIRQLRDNGVDVSSSTAIRIAFQGGSDAQGLDLDYIQAVIRESVSDSSFDADIRSPGLISYLSHLNGLNLDQNVKNALAGAATAQTDLISGFVAARDALIASGLSYDVARSRAYTQIQYRPELLNAYANGYLQSVGGAPLNAVGRERFNSAFEQARFAGATEATAARLALDYARSGRSFTVGTVKIGLSDAQILAENARQSRTISAADLLREVDQAISIARAAGNDLGLVLGNLVRSFVAGQAARGDSIRGNSIIETANGLGQTFEGLVRLIGRGDLVAFGAVFSDVGSVIGTASNGSRNDEAGPGLALFGTALRAIGTVSRQKELVALGSILRAAGTAVGSVRAAELRRSEAIANIRADNTLSDAQKAVRIGNVAGVNYAGISLSAVSSIASAFASITTDQALNRVLSAVSIGTGDGFNAIQQLRFDSSAGSVALGAAASRLLGTLIGGRDGARITAVGQLAQSAFDIARGSNPTAGALTALQSLATIAGIRVPAEANYFLNLAATAAAPTPLGWALFGVQTLFNLARIGSFSRTSLIRDDLDLDGDKFFDDRASLRNTYFRNFFGSVNLRDSRIVYEVQGVNPNVPHSIEYQILNGGSNRIVAYATGSLSSAFRRDADGNYILSQAQFDELMQEMDDEGSFSGLRFANGDGGSYTEADTRLRGTRVSTFSFITDKVGIQLRPTYSNLNPSVGIGQSYTAANSGVRLTVRPDQLAAFRREVGASSTQLSGNLPFGSKGQQYLEKYIKDISITFVGEKDDPNLYFYLDLNGDEAPDLVRLGLQSGPNGERLSRPGDGKFEVTFLDDRLRAIGGKFTVSNLNDATVVGRNYDLLLRFGASHPELWSRGRDAGDFYYAIQASAHRRAAFADLDVRRQSVARSFESGDVNETRLLRDLEGIRAAERTLGIVFDPASYVAANPNVSALRDRSELEIIQHYLTSGNSSRLAIDSRGTVLQRYVAPQDNRPPINAAGNTTYTVERADEVITEAANGGTDTVRTSLGSYTLGANVERLVYTGEGNFQGTGNALNNVITGGRGNDVLNGGAGNDILNGGAGFDTLEGGAGSDTLDGGLGSDRFVYSARGFGSDVINGFAAGNGPADVLVFHTSVFSNWQEVLSKSARVGSDTVITLNASDKITLKGVALSDFKPDDVTFYR